MTKIIDYIKETKGEMKHVSWPTRKQTVAYTLAVIAISIVVSLYLGLFDFIFKILLENFILK